MSNPAAGSTRHDVQSTWARAALGDMHVMRSGLLTAHGVRHAFTLRPDNMSIRRAPDAEIVVRRRQDLCRLMHLNVDRLTSMEQVHGDRGAVTTAKDWGHLVGGVDALVVHGPGVPLLALSADCPLIVAFDPQANVLGLAHAGWRGTVAGLAACLVRTMARAGACDPAQMVAAIAPSAGPCCYEVGDDVVESAARLLPEHERYFPRREGRTHFDLWSANIDQLTAAGIPHDRIDLAARCTICDGAYFSYRRDGLAGGHAGLIAAL